MIFISANYEVDFRHFSFVWAITQLAGIGIYKAKMIDAGDID